MNPYSHVIIASKLEALIRPRDPAQYYWGAVAPDMRYLAAMPRAQTHIPGTQIVAFMNRYPHLESFVQGYLVHCLADEVHLGRYMAVLLELYFLERHPISPKLAGTHNEFLAELGLSAPVSARFGEAAQAYVELTGEPDPLILARLVGMEGDPRLEAYAEAARWFQSRDLLKKALFLGIRAGRVGERIAARVAAKLKTT